MATYDVTKTADGPVWVKSSISARLSTIDSAVFDCDGVLIDTRKSYDATIAYATAWLLRKLVDVNPLGRRLAAELTYTLRATGRFNNDWDTVYALTIFSTFALPSKSQPKISRDTFEKRIRGLVHEFCSSNWADSEIWEQVDTFLKRKASQPSVVSAIARSRAQLSYPGKPPESLLATVFDEVYHGPELFRNLYGVPARFYTGPGLIEKEKLLIQKRDLEDVSKMLGLGRTAMVTGRPSLAVKYMLKGLMSYFNFEASTFIGDLYLSPEDADKVRRFRKPSPNSLLRAQEVFSSSGLVYVGDSAEDMIMVKEAQRINHPIVFAAVYGAKSKPTMFTKFFLRQGVDAIMPNVRQLPRVLRMCKDARG